MITIKASSTGLKSVSYNNICFEGFRIYNKDGVIFSTNRSYFESQSIKDGAKSYLSNSITSFNLNMDIVKRNKVNLSKVENFYTYESFEYKGKCPVLYIHESEINVTNEREIISLKQEHETSYIIAYDFTFINGYTVRELERFEIDDITKYTGDMSKVKKVDDNYYYLSYIENNYNVCSVTSDFITRIEKDKYGLQNDNIASAIKGILNKDLCSWEIEKLRKVLNISVK